jgi:hypothetical protein
MRERGRETERKNEREIKKDEELRVEGIVNDTKENTKFLMWKPLKRREKTTR